MKRQRALANRMFEEAGMLTRKQSPMGRGGPPGGPRSRYFSKPRYEIVDDNKVFKLSIDVPGIKPEDMSISLEDGYLTVRGQRASSDDNTQFSSQFSQTFSLDPAIDLDGIKANLENGVLTISAPKDMAKLEENVRRIPITSSTTTEEQDVSTNFAIADEETAEEKAEDVVNEMGDEELEITEDKDEPETDA